VTSKVAGAGSNVVADRVSVEVVVMGMAVDRIRDPASRLMASTFHTRLEILLVTNRSACSVPSLTVGTVVDVTGGGCGNNTNTNNQRNNSAANTTTTNNDSTTGTGCRSDNQSQSNTTISERGSQNGRSFGRGGY
jgi:hypothetical protein